MISAPRLFVWIRPLLFAFALAPETLLAADGELADLRARAENGDASAQYQLGLAYIDGRAAHNDFVNAYVWLTLACENGDHGDGLEFVIQGLNRNQFLVATRRLAEWHARHAVATKPVSASPAPSPADEAASATETDPRLSNLRTANEALAAEKQKLAADLVSANAHTTQARLALEDARAQLAAAQMELAELRRQPAPSATPVDTGRVAELEKQLAQLRNLNDALAADKEKLANEVASSWKEADQLRARASADEKARAGEADEMRQKVTRLASELSDAQAAFARQQEVLASAQAALEQTRQGVSASTERDASLAAARAELENRDRSLDEAAARLEAATKELNELRETNTRLTATNRQLEQDSQVQLDSLTAAGAELQRARATLTGLTEEKTFLARDAVLRADQARQLVALAARAEAAEKAMAEAREAAAKAAGNSQQLDTIMKEKDTLVARLDEAGRRLQAAEAATKEAAEKTGAAENARLFTEQELADAAARLAAAQKQLDDLAKAPQPEDPRLAELTQKLQAAETGAAALRSAEAELTKNLQAREAETAALKKQAADATERYEAAEAAAADRAEKLRAAETDRRELAAVKDQLAAAQSALRDAQAAANAAAELPALREKLAGIEQQRATLLLSYNQLKSTYDQLAANTTALRLAAADRDKFAAQYADAAREVEHLGAAFAQLMQQLTVMRTDLAAARTAAATLTAENARLRDAPVRAALATAPVFGPGGAAGPAAPPPAEPAPRTHLTANGDTLTALSKKYYGTSARWRDIYNANRSVLPNENLLPRDVELVIP